MLFAAQPVTIFGPESSGTVWLGPLVYFGGFGPPRNSTLSPCGTLFRAPPLAVPPLSCKTTVRVVEPMASGAGVKLRVPFGAMAGPAENNSALVLPVIRKVTD